MERVGENFLTTCQKNLSDDSKILAENLPIVIQISFFNIMGTTESN